MPDIRLNTIEIKNYRTIADAKLDYSAGVIGLIGVNASGKTNVSRASVLLCELIRTSLPKIQGRGNAITDLEQSTWPVLDKIEPSALLYDPAPNNELTISATFCIPNYVIPKDQGQVLKEIESSESHQLLVAATLRVDSRPNGQVRFLPHYDVRLDEKTLVNIDIQQLNNLWPQFKAGRLQALRPASEFLSAMRNLRDESVAGHNAFDRLNDHLLELNANFARVSFIGKNPMGIEGDISDLSVDNMSSGNLKALQLVSAAINPEMADVVVLHLEEPEAHFHPSLQRAVLRSVIANCRSHGVPVSIETHSPEVLRELYEQEVPVYRVEVTERHKRNATRRSRVRPLPKGPEAMRFLSSMGADAGFSILGGITIITDGPTDPPAYRQFLSLFPDIRDELICFVPIGCLDAHGLDLSGLGQLSERCILLADGHFIKQHGDQLQEKCSQAGITYIQLEHWGVENFFSLQALRQAAKILEGLTVSDDAKLDAMTHLKKTDGVEGFSKSHHIEVIAQYVKKKELESQQDFMRLVDSIKTAKKDRQTEYTVPVEAARFSQSGDTKRQQ